MNREKIKNKGLIDDFENYVYLVIPKRYHTRIIADGFFASFALSKNQLNIPLKGSY